DCSQTPVLVQVFENGCEENATYTYNGPEGECLPDFPFGVVNGMCDALPTEQFLVREANHVGAGCNEALAYQATFYGTNDECYQAGDLYVNYECDCTASPYTITEHIFNDEDCS